jgi:hypothetical protein
VVKRVLGIDHTIVSLLQAQEAHLPLPRPRLPPHGCAWLGFPDPFSTERFRTAAYLDRPARVLSAWPLSQTQCAELSARTYDASEHFWNPLARRTDTAGEIPDSPALAPLKAMTYADGTPVLKDLRLTGWRFIRDVLRAFDHEDNVAFKELGYDRWSEENQKSPKNDVFILRAVLRALEKSPPPGP